MERLRAHIVAFFQKDLETAELLVPWDRQQLRGEIFSSGEVLEERHDEIGTTFRLRAARHDLEKLRRALGGG